MKKIILIFILLFSLFSCTLEERKIWTKEEVWIDNSINNLKLLKDYWNWLTSYFSNKKWGVVFYSWDKYISEFTKFDVIMDIDYSKYSTLEEKSKAYLESVELVWIDEKNAYLLDKSWYLWIYTLVNLEEGNSIVWKQQWKEIIHYKNNIIIISNIYDSLDSITVYNDNLLWNPIESYSFEKKWYKAVTPIIKSDNIIFMSQWDDQEILDMSNDFSSWSIFINK